MNELSTTKIFTYEQIEKILSKWVGTPYKHRMAIPGEGVDCVHLAVAILAELGINVEIPSYQRLWKINDPGFFEKELYRMADRWKEIPENKLRFGDIGLIREDPFDPDSFIKHCYVVIDSVRMLHILDDSLPQARIEEMLKYKLFTSKYIRFVK